MDMLKEVLALAHKMSLEKRLFERNKKVTDKEMEAFYDLDETKVNSKTIIDRKVLKTP